MAKTLLQGVNQVLKFAGWIKGNSGELLSLTDSQRQVVVDQAVQSWNEVVADLYSEQGIMTNGEISTATVYLLPGIREYTLPSNLLRVWWPIFNQSTGAKCYHYPGGFQRMWEDQIDTTVRTGRPLYATVNPINGSLYIDSEPEAADDQYPYTIYYERTLAMSLAADVFPFNDDVYTLLVPAVVEKMKMARDEQSVARFEVSQAKYDRYLGLSARALKEYQQPLNYVYEPAGCPTTGESLGSGGGGGGGGTPSGAVTYLGVPVTNLGVIVTSP